MHSQHSFAGTENVQTSQLSSLLSGLCLEELPPTWSFLTKAIMRKPLLPFCTLPSGSDGMHKLLLEQNDLLMLLWGPHGPMPLHGKHEALSLCFSPLRCINLSNIPWVGRDAAGGCPSKPFDLGEADKEPVSH